MTRPDLELHLRNLGVGHTHFNQILEGTWPAVKRGDQWLSTTACLAHWQPHLFSARVRHQLDQIYTNLPKVSLPQRKHDRKAWFEQYKRDNYLAMKQAAF